MTGKKIFISYTHREPDETIAQHIYQLLKSANYQPFLTTKAARIAEHSLINGELKACEGFVVLLSERSMMSDMLTEEVKIAKEEHLQRKITLIPICIDLSQEEIVNYDIAHYLRDIEPLIYQNDNFTSLVSKILDALQGESKQENKSLISVAENTKNLPIPNAPLINPGGTVAHNAAYYIVRKNENQFISQVLREGALLRINAPRQFGKTSLVARIINFAKENNHAIVALSLQQMGIEQIKDLDKLLIQLCSYATRRLQLPNKIKEYWDDDFMDVKMKCEAYFEEHLLANTPQSILFAIDEADRVFEFPEVSAEFFSLLRSWHEARNINPIWNKFKLVVSHSTEAYLAIQQINQSPFNVGVECQLNEFDESEVREFAQRLQVNLSDTQIQTLMEMLGGHPFLVHTALYVLAKGEYSFEDLMQNAANDNSPFNDHLRRHLWTLSQSEIFGQTMKQILNHKPSSDTLICHKLRAAGLIKGTVPNLKPRFKLYENYLKDKL